MKLALLLLVGVCLIALTTGSIPVSVENQLKHTVSEKYKLFNADGLLDILQQIINKLIDQTKIIINDILSRTQNIINGIFEQIRVIGEKARQAIAGISKGILDKIQKAIQEGAVAKQCGDEARDSVKHSTQQAQDQIQFCINDGIEQTKNIQQDIEQSVEAIQNNIDELKTVVATCLEQYGNPIKIAWCITDQTNKLRENIIGLVSNVMDGIKTVTVRSVEITLGTQSCIQKTISDLSRDILRIETEFADCIEQNRP